MKKAFDQTVRDLKREVNKTVLKIPKIEQKVLDATSNEPWGPHGSLLADIAQATRNYHEYQMIMGILWKRINDTGKNWRHVYKGLTVLEYLVGHGSERVIDDIREHAYQISTLSDFQYIDSNGRDQGNNVRKKSQNLVALVNDKERIIEVRQKAAANRDKFRSASSMGSMYRPSSGGYDDRYEGRYGSRDGDRNVDSYGRERDYGFRDDRSGRNEDSYGRDYEERYNRDGYKDDDYRGRSRNIDDYQYGSRSRSSDRDGERAYDDDGQVSSRNNGARPDEPSPVGRQLERKFSEQNIAPPSYEEAVNESGSTVPSQSVSVNREVEAPATTAPRAFPPPVSSTPSQQTTHGTTASPHPQGPVGSDEFDPRGSVPVAPNASSNLETNLFDSLALVPVGPVTSSADSECHVQTSATVGSFTQNQTFEDPFGDSPFKAISSTGVQDQTHFQRGESFSAATYSKPDVPVQPQPNLHHPREETLQHQNIGVLADLLPPETLPAAVSQPTYTTSNQPVQPNSQAASGLPAQSNPNLGNYQRDGNIAAVNFQNQTEPGREFGNGMFVAPGGIPAHVSYMAPPNAGPNAQPNNFGTSHNGSAVPASSHHTLQTTRPPAHLPSGNYFNTPQGSVAPVASQVSYQTSNFPVVKSEVMGSFNSQAGNYTSMASQQNPPAGPLSTASQASKNKFETKSTVWSDTLSRGLVNLNISGPKANPTADIGVDFEALNRKEKRMEKPSTAPVVSTINMGKAMGSGSGIGRAGASALRPLPNAMSGSGSGMGMGMGMGMNPNPGMGMGMRGYGGMNQPMGGMSMNMGMGQQGFQMQQPRANMPGVYNPMMGSGGYAPQQPPYGSYR